MTKRSISKKHGHRSEKGYTRLKYIKRGAKGTQVVKFTVGTTGDYTHELSLVALREKFVPEVVLESVRLALGHALADIKDRQYVFRILPYPHHILRTNKILGTAKAERISEGMRRSFGKSIGLKAAHVKKNQAIVKLWVYEEYLKLAKNALRIAKGKIGVPCKIMVEKSQGSPRVTRKEIEPLIKKPLPILRPKKGV